MLTSTAAGLIAGLPATQASTRQRRRRSQCRACNRRQQACLAARRRARTTTSLAPARCSFQQVSARGCLRQLYACGAAHDAAAAACSLLLPSSPCCRSVQADGVAGVWCRNRAQLEGLAAERCSQHRQRWHDRQRELHLRCVAWLSLLGVRVTCSSPSGMRDERPSARVRLLCVDQAARPTSSRTGTAPRARWRAAPTSRWCVASVLYVRMHAEPRMQLRHACMRKRQVLLSHRPAKGNDTHVTCQSYRLPVPAPPARGARRTSTSMWAADVVTR